MPLPRYVKVLVAQRAMGVEHVTAEKRIYPSRNLPSTTTCPSS